MKFYQSHSIKNQKDFMEYEIRKAGVVGSNPIGGSQIYYKENNAGSNIKNKYQIVPKNV